MMGRFTGKIRLLFELKLPPSRIAAGIAVGAFSAFFPLWGLQTVLALALAFLFRLHKMAATLGSLLSNPWTYPLIVVADFRLGQLLLGENPQIFSWEIIKTHGFWANLHSLLGPGLKCATVGFIILGSLAGLLVYPISFYFIKRKNGPR